MGLPPAVGTWYGDLERVFGAVGLRTWRVPEALAGAPDAELRLMQQAVAGGAPVIAMVHGATLGRGERYADHWVVVVGFNAARVCLFAADHRRLRSAG